MFFNSEIKLAANDSQHTYKTLQNVLAKKPSERTQVLKNVLVNKLIIDEPKLSLIILMTFLLISVQNSQKFMKKPTSTLSQNFFLNTLVHLCILILPLQPKFVVINALGSKKAVGCDDIPSEFIKFSAVVIAQYYFNFSFYFGIFPGSGGLRKGGPLRKLNGGLFSLHTTLLN